MDFDAESPQIFGSFKYSLSGKYPYFALRLASRLSWQHSAQTVDDKISRLLG
jgi:hypothetical protein